MANISEYVKEIRRLGNPPPPAHHVAMEVLVYVVLAQFFHSLIGAFLHGLTSEYFGCVDAGTS